MLNSIDQSYFVPPDTRVCIRDKKNAYPDKERDVAPAGLMHQMLILMQPYYAAGRLTASLTQHHLQNKMHWLHPPH